MKIAIIDDEKHACETLKWQLEELDRGFSSIRIFQEPIEAVNKLKKDLPDLIFLDIEMPGLNGFQFLEALNQPDIHVIFTTAYDKFAVDAFRVNAVDYLIKPVDIEALKGALDRIPAEKTDTDADLLKRLFEQISRARTGKVKIGLPSIHGIDFIDCDDIIYCQSESNYTRIYLESDRKILASKTLKDIGAMLPEILFYRVHNSYIVNLEKISSYTHDEGGTIVLNNTFKIRVSRNKKKELLELLEHF